MDDENDEGAGVERYWWVYDSNMAEQCSLASLVYTIRDQCGAPIVVVPIDTRLRNDMTRLRTFLQSEANKHGVRDMPFVVQGDQVTRVILGDTETQQFIEQTVRALPPPTVKAAIRDTLGEHWCTLLDHTAVTPKTTRRHPQPPATMAGAGTHNVSDMAKKQQRPFKRCAGNDAGIPEKALQDDDDDTGMGDDQQLVFVEQDTGRQQNNRGKKLSISDIISLASTNRKGV